MNIACFILAGAFLGLLFSKIISKKDNSDTLKKQETIATHTPACVEKISDTNVNGTPLDKEHVRQAIIFNGFVPSEAGDGWFAFKVQGETYGCSYNNGPLMQFYKGYGIDLNDKDIQFDFVVRAARKVIDETLMGRIVIDENPSDPGIAFKVTGIEMTYEHLCVSFMEYIRLLEDLHARHGYEYHQMCEAEDVKVHPSYAEMPRDTKVLS